MLYYFLYPLDDVFSFLNIFRYLTFRSAMATITAFLISILFGPWLIKRLKQWKVGENIRKEESQKLYELHSKKQDTPTMGGILILAAVTISTLLWADVFNSYVLMALFVTLWLGITGFIDDYLKQKRKKSKGLSARAKILSQVLLGLIFGIFLYFEPQHATRLDIPFMKDLSVNLGIWYVFFVVLVITATSNSVNLTDGLDGLAIGAVIMVALAFAVLSYVSGNAKLSSYLLIPHIKAGGELAVFCASLLGAGLGFLWFNCYPASIFMGDVGSLALGGALGAVAILIKKELLLIVVGGIFVVEAISVIAQVFSFRVWKKRIFKIAPLHHHFQFLGWPESKVIIRFWIVAGLLALFTLVTLKIR
jgi:phospho-N-acetylmuramoyl-pentapeptide-transferase